MAGKKSRNKGKQGELEVVSQLMQHGWEATRGMFPPMPDVVTNFPFHVEVKRQEKLNIYAAILQAESKEKPPAVIFRKSNSKWYAAIEFSELLKLCRKQVN